MLTGVELAELVVLDRPQATIHDMLTNRRLTKLGRSELREPRTAPTSASIRLHWTSTLTICRVKPGGQSVMLPVAFGHLLSAPRNTYYGNAPSNVQSAICRSISGEDLLL